MKDTKISDDQLKCIQAYLSGRMELNHGERITFYKDYFGDDDIESTKDLDRLQASLLVTEIKEKPDKLSDKVEDALGWKKLI